MKPTNEDDDKKILSDTRKVQVLRCLCHGMSTWEEIRNNAFERDLERDYSKYIPIKYRGANPQANSGGYVSRQEIDQKLKELENIQVIRSMIHYYINDKGQQQKVKLYALTAQGAANASGIFGYELNSIRYDFAAKTTSVGHEHLITRVVRKLFSDAEGTNKYYDLNYVYADRVLRSIFSREKGRLPNAGDCFYDLKVSVTSSIRANVILSFEIANRIIHDEGYWFKKIHYFNQIDLFFLINNHTLYNNLILWSNKWQLPNAFFLSMLSDFLTNGLRTVWTEVLKDKVKSVSLRI